MNQDLEKPNHPLPMRGCFDGCLFGTVAILTPIGAVVVLSLLLNYQGRKHFSISGSVVDENQSVVPDAVVILTCDLKVDILRLPGIGTECSVSPAYPLNDVSDQPAGSFNALHSDYSPECTVKLIVIAPGFEIYEEVLEDDSVWGMTVDDKLVIMKRP